MEEDSREPSNTVNDNEEFVGEPISLLSPNAMLARASRVHNLPVMCHALALGASLTALHPPGPDAAMPLHHAILSGSVCAVEYLLLNGAAPNLQDSEGRTPLHLAVSRSSIPQVEEYEELLFKFLNKFKNYLHNKWN